MPDSLRNWILGPNVDDVVLSRVGFGAPLPFLICVALVVGAGVITAWLYWRKSSGVRQPVRSALVALRTGFIALALLLALDPVVIGHRVTPGEQFVALLFDDSMSMRIAGQDGRTRGQRLLDAYTAAEEQFEDRLMHRHRVAYYRVGSGAVPLQAVNRLSFDQQDSELIDAVSQAQLDLSDASLAAVVLFSDGVLQGGEPLRRDPASLPSDVPVYTVGVEEPSEWRDIGLTDLSYRTLHFDDSPINLNLGIASTGLAGREAIVEVLDGSLVLASETIQIESNDQEHTVQMEFRPHSAGWVEFEARVRIKGPGAGAAAGSAAAPLDRIGENNSWRFVVDNRERQYRILYYAGRPTWENKFLRRAVEDDRQLNLSSLVAISGAERKFVFRGSKSTLANPLFEGFDHDEDRPRYDEAVFLRLGVESGELAGGFPSTPEEMFQYDAVILGDVERDFINDTQMELLHDFVEKRGGALLVMGGPRAFSLGGYNDTLLEDMLPVALYPATADPAEIRLEAPFRVEPTMEGKLGGAWAMETPEGGPSEVLTQFPAWFGANTFAMVRPGATVMAKAVFEDSALGEAPLYVTQPYGEGMCAVFATSDTWEWQMRYGPEDTRHERLWRQLLRGLVKEADTATYWRNKQDAYALGRPARIEFQVRDKAFDPREGLQTSVLVTTPSGREIPLPVDESIEQPGVYAAEFAAEEPGVHLVRLNAADDAGEVIANISEGFLVEPDHREFQNARYNETFLLNLAAATGGEFYTLDELDELAEAIPLPVRPDAERVVVHLWHRPLFFVLLAAMMIPEWYLRRTRGRA